MITICPLTEEDIPAAVELEKCCFSDPWSSKGLRDTLHEDCACFFAAKDEQGILCGYLNATWILDECNLNRICVHPVFRRNRIAENLLTALKDFCRKHNISHIFLEVRESNQAARALYCSNHFVELGRRPRFYEKPEEDAILMEWTEE
ncbi:MAG: ribosomal protein S18-alanine N-acetyltransferase [Candidatus Merdivicinus sp.]